MLLKVRVHCLVLMVGMAGAAHAQTTSSLFKTIPPVRTAVVLNDTGAVNDTVKTIIPSDSAMRKQGVVNPYRTLFHRYGAYLFAKVAYQKYMANVDQHKAKVIALKKQISVTSTLQDVKDYNAEKYSADSEYAVNLQVVDTFLNHAITDHFYDRLSRTPFFPVGNATDAQLYYQNGLNDSRSKFLQNSTLSFNADATKASLYTEIYADYFGPFRLGLGTLVSNSSSANAGPPTTASDTANIQQDAFQRLLGGGGNATFIATYPLLGLGNASSTAELKVVFTPKFSFDIPQMGALANQSPFNTDFGIDFTAYVTGKTGLFTLLASARIAGIIGNKDFYSNLNKPDNQPFMLNQTSLGIAIHSTFRIIATKYWGSKFVTSQFPSYNIGLAVIPN